MEAVVLKISDTEAFDEVVKVFRKQGFDNLTILEEYGLTEEEIIARFIELQAQYSYVLILPPLPPNVTNKIMAKMLITKKEEDN